MAITINGQEMYKGAVLREHEHMWMDGMLEVHTIVWDMDEHKERWIQTGYYGADGNNLNGGMYSNIVFEVSADVARDIIRTMKRRAVDEYCRSVTEERSRVCKGRKAVVVRGRKVRKGTELDVFWVGERETFRSRRYSWMHETETVAGCYDADGNKVWIKVEYLENATKIKSPVAGERDKFIKAYVRKNVPQWIRDAARKGCTIMWK